MSEFEQLVGEIVDWIRDQPGAAISRYTVLDEFVGGDTTESDVVDAMEAISVAAERLR